ncbi:hypothetical protein LCGC14_1267230 [marine sediment metagenome]|uniref:Uncharacterized protein n=1 Tax=marine sediment metagenome TaxID=412755 RepID=A0A0F9LK38_9ZZZZ
MMGWLAVFLLGVFIIAGLVWRDKKIGMKTVYHPEWDEWGGQTDYIWPDGISRKAKVIQAAIHLLGIFCIFGGLVGIIMYGG